MSIKQVLNGIRYSLAGLKNAVTTQASFRIELIISVILFPTAILLGNNGVERALLIGVLFLVLITELINSAIETTVNRIGFEKHDLSRQSKDLASAAVFISLINVPIVWGLVIFN